MDLRINSGLCADSILNRVVKHARFLDIKGPNMRDHIARRKAELEKGFGTSRYRMSGKAVLLCGTPVLAGRSAPV